MQPPPAFPLEFAMGAGTGEYVRSLDRLRAWSAQETGALRRQLAALGEIVDGRRPLAFAFQPIVDLKRGAVAGYEALSRFPPPLEGSPARWYSLAESLGLDLSLQDRALRTLAPARATIPPNCFLTFNVTPQYLLSPLFSALITELGDLRGLVVEVTENAEIADFASVQRRIEEVRRAGGCFAVDDAGAGYASLNHVLQTRPDLVKIDRVFISECQRDRAKSALIEMLGQVAGRLDAWIVAEGVETDGELEELQRLNVPLAQGFRLGRPQPEMGPLDAAVELLLSNRVARPGSDSALSRAMEAHAEGVTGDAARGLLAKEPRVDIVVVVDEWRRPVGLVERHPLCGVREVSAVMRVQRTDGSGAVLERALTRDPKHRFDPLVVTDEAGRSEGVVRIDRLAALLAGRLRMTESVPTVISTA